MPSAVWIPKIRQATGPKQPGNIGGGVGLAPLLVGLAGILYLLTAPGHLQSGDMRSEFAVAQSMTAGSFAVMPSLPTVDVPSVTGSDGRQYSKYGVGQSILLLPAAAVGRLAGCPADPAHCPAGAQRRAEEAASLLDGVMAALTVGLLFLLALELGASAGAAVALALLFGFATIEWDYAHDSFDVGPAGFFILAALFAARRAAVRDGIGWPLLAGAATGFAVLVRITDVGIAPLVAAYLLLAIRPDSPRRAVRAVLLFSLAVTVALALIGVYDWMRFGSFFETGYGLSPDPIQWRNPLAGGLAGLLFSPGKGLFVYSPVLLAAMLGWGALFRRDRAFTILLAAIVVEMVALYSSYAVWSGDWAWGPRYLVPVTALLILPLLPSLEGWRKTSTRWRVSLVALSVLSAAVAMLGVAVDYLHQIILEVTSGRDIAAYWNPSRSAVWRHLETIVAIVQGTAPYPAYSGPGDVAMGVPTITTFDFWWVYELTKGTSPLLVLSLLAMLVLISLRLVWHIRARLGA